MADDENSNDTSPAGNSGTAPKRYDGGALSLAQLIGAPIHALIDAEAQAALTTANFIRNMGFEGGDHPGDLGPMRMASFRHNRTNNNGEQSTIQVDLPFLSLLPIPALQIKDAELEYTVKVLRTETDNSFSKESLQQQALQPSPLIEQPAIMRASLAPESSASKRGRSLDMLVKMKVTVQQSDIPAGLGRLLNYMSDNIQHKDITEIEDAELLNPSAGADPSNTGE
ncbi:DUF2589 domain-containing protein [Halioxenophilus sp. WMMB6]|uniref:DUF2589 domain-containing protein n=1 Tax=Halioxenophilus sp. WMMB6 TaxID=3073815 RepID=UPI00295E5194|nr:DUF2589 domain-containing protein [Halioxenophilus sp. WMMB6]